MPLANIKKRFRKKRLNAALFMATAVFAAVYLLNAVAYREPLALLFVAGFAALAWLAWRRRPQAAPTPDDAQAASWCRDRYDRTHRSAYFWMFAAFLGAALVVFSSLMVSVNDSKPQELWEFIESSLTLVELLAIALGTSLILARWTAPYGDPERVRHYRRGMIAAAAASLVYWGAALSMFTVFNTGAMSAFLAAAAIYVALALLFCARRRGKALYRNFAFSKLRLGIGAAVLAALALGYLLQRDVWLVQPYINLTPNVSPRHCEITYDDDTGVYTIANPGGDFTILQLTDIHIGGSYASYLNDVKALHACFALIEHTRPDLVIVTGDLCYPVGISSFSLNNTAPVMQFASFMRNTGVPWAFTYGNHDTEAMAASSKDSLDALYRSLSWRTSKNLLYPYVQPDVTGRNNQLIEVRNPDGTLNTALFLIDSNAYVGQGFSKYDFIHDDQVDWYAAQVERLNAEEGRVVPSMAFFHIPLQEYRTAYELYTAGSDEVTWYFGSNDEKTPDKVCCSEYPSALFDRMKALGSTRAVFCGHDHYNNMSLEYRGIRLTYGMSIDYLVMPGIARETAQRGGTVITLHPDGSWDIEQVPLTSIAAS